MSRARAKALVLVNWRGVFYERYLLDSHVTALEGTNGAGKTTVLIGCYVVLLPDMTRLRFTNLGEHAPSGGDRGLWGRLGESSRPAYAVLELGVEGGERLLAGVHLQRKAEPTVDLTPFIITGLDHAVRLQDILLDRGEMDSVPEMSQLRDQVAGNGGVLQVFSTAKEYFAALFDRGITPLRLAGESDRHKLNEMLRTSMTGGISRALTSELREFLLKEEAGLADTLKRMRANLESCRRTRTEVEESRRLEEEIAGVYDAGQQMFAAAIHATRERAEELRRRFDDTTRLVQEAEAVEQTLGRDLEMARGEGERLDSQLEDAQRQLQDARSYLDRLKRAQVIDLRIQERRKAFSRSQEAHEAARTARAQAETHRLRARRERDEAQRDLEAATSSLADLQKGLEELQRRASEHSLAVRYLDQARELLPDAQVEAHTAASVLSDIEQRYNLASEQYNRLLNTVRNADQRRRDFGAVLESLEAIAGSAIKPTEAFEHAQQASAELRSLDAKAARREELSNAIRECQKLAEQQKQARSVAAELSTASSSLESSESVRSALDQLEADLESTAEILRAEEVKANTAATTCRNLDARKNALEHDLVAWREILNRVEPLEQQFEMSLRSREELQPLRARLHDQRDADRDERSRLQVEQQQYLEDASHLEQSGGTFPSSLLRARDAVDGELLAGQFEELPIAQAGEVEALLGPLAQAIVVDDPRVAADKLCDYGDTPNSIWLVGGDSVPSLNADGRPEGVVTDGHVVVSGSEGWRVSRIPERPTLGRRARAQRIADLREHAHTCAIKIEQLESNLRNTASVLNATERLLADAGTLEHGDPSEELAQVQSSLQATTAAEKSHRDEAMRISADVDALSARRHTFRSLLPVAWLLDEPDQQGRLIDLKKAMDAAKCAAQRILDVATPRAVLEAQMDVLRTPPSTPEQVAEMQGRLESLQAEQEKRLKAIGALRYVDEHRTALTWTDASDALKREIALEPALENQLKKAHEAAERARDAVDAADAAVNQAVEHFNDVDAQVKQLAEAIKLDQQEWQSCEVESATSQDVHRAEEAVESADANDRLMKSKSKDISDRIARLDERLKAATKTTNDRRNDQADAERGWQPNQERWDRLETLATEQGVLASAMTRRFVDMFGGRGSANVRTEAREAATSLKERLTHARDSSDVLSTVNEFLGSQELSGEACLHAWLAVRDWLRRRIPAQISEVAEPIEALQRLRSHLTGLEERLGRQEHDLRGDSSNVAASINIHIRRAQNQVKRLNQDLGDVRFGSIHGVRLRLERVDRMDQVLHALHDGDAQSLLFQTDIPIEQALDELFRRFGGGGKTTGQRLLDYRAYIEPKVEVRRQSSELWEVANPMRMSTGEAIGVGAALMMVVLTAWERDANLLRPKRSHGTLRLLFLDEANRLSQDNLSVLFDLCQSLDLQLIIAAPEVAQAEGNTTYRLIRRVNEAGQEEVIVSGRRLAIER